MSLTAIATNLAHLYLWLKVEIKSFQTSLLATTLTNLSQSNQAMLAHTLGSNLIGIMLNLATPTSKTSAARAGTYSFTRANPLNPDKPLTICLDPAYFEYLIHNHAYMCRTCTGPLNYSPHQLLSTLTLNPNFVLVACWNCRTPKAGPDLVICRPCPPALPVRLGLHQDRCGFGAQSGRGCQADVWACSV